MSAGPPATGAGDTVRTALGRHVVALTLAPEPSWPADPPNVYLIRGERAWAMFDAGWGRPEDLAAIDHLLAAEAPTGRPIALILSHAHRDHVGGARHLAEHHALEARALAPERETAARHGLTLAFDPLTVGETLDLGGVRLTVLATPGHTAGSLSLHLRADGDDDVLFTGDTVVGRHSAWVGPPDGDLDAYLATLARLGSADAPWAAARLAPGHGPIGGPAAATALALRERRLGRDRDILRLLDAAPTPRALARALYGEGTGLILGPGGVAERTVLAHLERLRRLGRVARGDDHPDGADDPFLVAYRRA